MTSSRKHKQNLIPIIVIGIVIAVIILCAIIFLTKSNGKQTPEELLTTYMKRIPEKEYEKMYAMLNVEASGNISKEDFVERNSAIYEGIEVQNIKIEIVEYNKEELIVTYNTSFDTAAGNMTFENTASFAKGEDGYLLVWDDSLPRIRVHR